jgi:hypothetical protein
LVYNSWIDAAGPDRLPHAQGSHRLLRRGIPAPTQLRNKINIAYEALTEEAFQNLLAVLKILYYLHPMPHFLPEINDIGSIPVSVFLENLLIKTRMVHLDITVSFRNWVLNLILKLKQAIPALKVEDIK